MTDQSFSKDQDDDDDACPIDYDAMFSPQNAEYVQYRAEWQQAQEVFAAPATPRSLSLCSMPLASSSPDLPPPNPHVTATHDAEVDQLARLNASPGRASVIIANEADDTAGRGTMMHNRSTRSSCSRRTASSSTVLHLMRSRSSSPSVRSARVTASSRFDQPHPLVADGALSVPDTIGPSAVKAERLAAERHARLDSSSGCEQIDWSQLSSVLLSIHQQDAVDVA